MDTQKNILKIKKIFVVILTIFCTGAHAHGWTDTDLCIWSYEGLIEYDLAEKGCQSKILQGLSNEEQEIIWQMSESQIEQVRKALKSQIDGIL